VVPKLEFPQKTMILLDLLGFEAIAGLCRARFSADYEYLRCLNILYRMRPKTVFPCQGGILGIELYKRYSLMQARVQPNPGARISGWKIKPLRP
jgi:hypothetical protein